MIKSAPQVLEYLWKQRFFKEWRTLGEVASAASELDCNPSDTNLHHALQRAEFLTRKKRGGFYGYRQAYAFEGKLLTEEVLPKEVVEKLGTEFITEINDLRLNYGRSGTCTAFLLRKILEKLIFLTFAKTGHSNELQDKTGEFVGLKRMLELAATHKVQGKPFLMPKTAKEIEGIKFLGDTAAHNPLISVKMETIVPVMPYIITAYQELAENL